MGRVKTTLIKRTGIRLFRENRSKIRDKFEDNKKLVNELTDISNKKLRNIIAGYLTRLAKRKNDLTLK